jgi:hypothetical protein
LGYEELKAPLGDGDRAGELTVTNR